MSAKYIDGAATNHEHGVSPFDIYRNALDLVMRSLLLDEDTACAVILHEFGGYANDWQKFGIRSAASELRAERPLPHAIDWGRAWMN